MRGQFGVWGKSVVDSPTRRKRRRTRFDIVTLNSNAWSTARTWLQLQSGTAQVVLLQEHRQLMDACDRAQDAAKRDGWRLGLAEAEATEHSTSAGVAVAVPAHIGMEPRAAERPWNDSPAAAPGRIASAWVNVLGGITVFSVYMRCTERWSDLNVQLMRHLAHLTQRTSAPYAAH